MSIIIQQELQPDSALIHIKNQYVKVTTVSENCSLESKDISHDDFLKILSSSMKTTLVDDSNFEQFTLGSNVIKFKASEDGFVYYFLVRKGKYPYNNGGRVRMIHYPNIIVKLVLDSQRSLRKTKLAIVKDADIVEKISFGVSSLMVKSRAMLYRYVLGNVDKKGNVCWGGNTFNGIDTYNALIEIVSTFFSSPSNIDFTGRNLNIDRATLLKQLEVSEFDENLLEPMTYTFEKF